MMHDLFLSTAQSCGIILFIAVTLVVLKWACRYLFAREKISSDVSEPVRVLPVKSSEKPKPLRASVELPEMEAPVPVAALESMAEHPVEPEFVIECGNCGKEIRSPRKGLRTDPGTLATSAIYECEHCHSRVAIAA